MWSNRLLLLLTCLLVFGGCHSAKVAGPRSLDEMLEPIRAKHRVPALGAALIENGRVTGIGAVGTRCHKSDVAVLDSDQWHLGSCTKAMTATMIARLVERGDLSWTDTIGGAFPEWKDSMQVAYAPVTLEQLLSHRGGLPVDRAPDWLYIKMRAMKGTLAEQRIEVARLTLRIPPDAPAGEKMLYSNRGYILAAAMAERRTGKSYEDLMEQEVFGPLDMKSVGWGPPGTVGKLDQPLGHSTFLGAKMEQEPTAIADNPEQGNPFGRAHCSLADWAKFIAAQMGHGPKRYLRPETLRKLHTPFGSGDDAYALGWLVMQRDWAKGAAPNSAGTVLVHDGTNAIWYAAVWIAPELDVAVLAATNQGPAPAAEAVDDACSTLILSR